jgi:chromosome segregation ATPase
MPFINREEYDELLSIKRYRDLDEDLNAKYDKEEKKLRKAYALRSEDLQEDLEDKLRAARKSIKADVELKDQEIEDLEEANEKLEETIEDLQGRVKTERDLNKQQVAIEEAQITLDADREAFEADQKAIAKDFAAEQTRADARHKKIEAELDAREKALTDKSKGVYKEGYTDGVADTLREAQKDVKEAVGENLKMATNVVDKALGKETTIVVATAAQPAQKQNNQKN